MITNFLIPMTFFNVLEVNDDPFETDFVQIEDLDRFYLMAKGFKEYDPEFSDANDDPFEINFVQIQKI